MACCSSRRSYRPVVRGCPSVTTIRTNSCNTSCEQVCTVCRQVSCVCRYPKCGECLPPTPPTPTDCCSKYVEEITGISGIVLASTHGKGLDPIVQISDEEGYVIDTEIKIDGISGDVSWAVNDALVTGKIRIY